MSRNELRQRHDFVECRGNLAVQWVYVWLFLEGGKGVVEGLGMGIG